MRTLHYLSGSESALFWPAIAAGVAVALVCGVLSVFVVLRRLAFIGHGVSHAAFGGVGLAVIAGLTAAGSANSLGYFALVGGFCIMTAVTIALVSARSAMREDTVIGLALVGSMALGAILLHLHARRGGSTGGATLESSLFGSILSVGPADAVVAWIVALGVGGTILWCRRPLIFCAFDETAAQAFGVNSLRARLLLMVLLGAAIVVAMKLAGVLLATALLILPGATALRLSTRLGPVFALSAATGVAGVLGGLMLSFETDWPPGPSVVVVLVALMLASSAVGVARR